MTSRNDSVFTLNVCIPTGHICNYLKNVKWFLYVNFEDKWQINQLTKQLKHVLERELVGLKTDMNIDFDQKVHSTLRQLDALIDVTVQRRMVLLKEELITEFNSIA